MGAFGGPTAKRHLLLSNDCKLVTTIEARGGPLYCVTLPFLLLPSKVLLLPGYLPKSRRPVGVPLVRKHVDKNGQSRQTGIKPNLKQSQILSDQYDVDFGNFVGLPSFSTTYLDLWWDSTRAKELY